MAKFEQKRVWRGARQISSEERLACALELEVPACDTGELMHDLCVHEIQQALQNDFMRGELAAIEKRNLLEEPLHTLAFYDALTKLPNRRLLDDRLAQIMAQSKRSGCYCAVMFLDMDKFKPLNDRYGHLVGDVLLIEVANRLTRCVREIDTVARFGGDEFVVMIGDLYQDRTKSIEQANVVAEKIRTSLCEPYLLKVSRVGEAEKIVEHHCSTSIGVVVFINHEESQYDILSWADEAMYQAKEEGRNLIRFYEG